MQREANRLVRRLAGRVLVAALLVASACHRTPVKPAAHSLPPPEPAGPTVTTVAVASPADAAGRTLFAGLKRDGRIVARGQAAARAQGLTTIELRAMDAAHVPADGPCELWLCLNLDDWQSCFPSFGDRYVRATLDLHPGAPPHTLPDPAMWQERRLSNPAHLVTVHYHRYDADYDNVSIWSWDADHVRSPADNELFEVGRDDFGLVFQLDRRAYGGPAGPERIGLVPRLAGDWNHKDGEDKFWAPSLGREVYLIGTREVIWGERPPLGAHVAAAYIDAPNQLVLQVSELVTADRIARDAVHVQDDTGHPSQPVGIRLLTDEGREHSNYLEVGLFEPLDPAHRFYTVAVDGFAGQVAAIPRRVLDEPGLFYDPQAVLGATYTPGQTTFRVFAPTAHAAWVVLYDRATGPPGRSEHALARADHGLWEATVPGDLAGKYYRYRLEGPKLAADREAVDIYAVNTVDSTRRARITNLAATNPPGWEAARRGPRVESPVDMEVYEMHVRDFSIAANSGMTHKGQYLAFTEGGTHLPDDPQTRTGLDHLVELGVTHVQLLPVQDFSNQENQSEYNWGYVTSAFNSPEGWYATNPFDESRVREFKALVKALHSRGLGVILDVVYNHTSHAAPFNQLLPRYYYRLMPDGSYANGSGCGNDFRTESPMGRKYIIDTLKHWVTEYGVDGFRFDLMALIDRETMTEVERELRQLNPAIVLYGEPWSAGSSPLKGKPTDKAGIRGLHIGAFNDNFRDALKGGPDGEEGGFIQNGSHRDAVKRGLEGSWRDWAPAPAQTINYLTCHDNLVLYDKLKRSKPHASEEELRDMMRLGYLLLFTAQGVPFLHGGEEFARTKGGHHNSYNAPDEVNEVDWSRKGPYHDLFSYVRDLIALRKTHPAFRIRAKEQVAAWLKFHDTADASTILFTIDASQVPGETWKQVCVVVNAADSLSVDLALPPGPWHVALDQHGALIGERVVENTIRVRYKSGFVLYQP